MKDERKSKKIIISLIVIVIILISIYFMYSNIISKTDLIFSTNEEFLVEDSIGIYEVSKVTSETYVKGSGTITSFDIQTIDIEEYEKVLETYVSEGQYVNEKDKIMKVKGEKNRCITSPISGVFFRVQKDEGNYEYKIYNVDEIGVSINVSEKDVSSLAIGQKVAVRVIALNQELEGTISYISMLPYDGKFKVNINIGYFEGIKFGYSTNVKILTSKNDEAIIVPYEALNIEDDGRYYVVKEEYKDYMLELEDYMKNYIEVGNITEDYAEVLSGLEVGMKILYWKW